MTIDEAIKKLKRTLEGNCRCCHPERYDALKLGIEALKRVQLHRKDHHSSYPTLLPGETLERNNA
jgi:hypothetical protein